MSNPFGGGSSTPSTQVVTQQSQEPWGGQQPFLKRGFSEAEKIFEGDKPQYFPGQTTVPFSPQTEQALGMTEARALQGSPLTPAAQNTVLGTVGGDYLSGSPFFQGAFDAQVRPAVEQYRNITVPGINSAFASATRTGSGAHQQAQQTAADTFARALSDTAGKLAYQNYGQERGLQQQAAFQAPGLAQADYLDPGQLGVVGTQREALGQAQLQDEINRFNFGQNVEANKLAEYMGLVGGGYGTTGTTTQPVFRNQGASLLGGALAGAGLGGMLGIENPLGLGGMALGGGLLGLGF